MGRYFQLFCIIDGAIGAAFALGLLVLPTGLMQLFAVHLDPAGVLFVRATGAILLGCSLVMIAFRNAPPSSELTAFLRIFGFADLLLGTLFLLAAYAGVLNALGYGLAAVCLGPGVLFLMLSRTGARLARVAA
jgi:FtsH-binding integral membrane protein